MNYRLQLGLLTQTKQAMVCKQLNLGHFGRELVMWCTGLARVVLLGYDWDIDHFDYGLYKYKRHGVTVQPCPLPNHTQGKIWHWKS